MPENVFCMIFDVRWISHHLSPNPTIFGDSWWEKSFFGDTLYSYIYVTCDWFQYNWFFPQATGDSHYLEVGKEVLENLNSLARVKCGFAAIKDVTAGTHEDQ